MLENLIEELLAEVNKSEIFDAIFKMLPCYENFFVINFCTDNVQLNPGMGHITSTSFGWNLSMRIAK